MPQDTNKNKNNNAVFHNQATGLIPGFDYHRSAILFDKDNHVLNFIAVGNNTGRQTSRLQVDVAADGNFHISGSTDGLGTYEMTFLDGPIGKTYEAPWYDPSNNDRLAENIWSPFKNLPGIGVVDAIINVGAAVVGGIISVAEALGIKDKDEKIIVTSPLRFFKKTLASSENKKVDLQDRTVVIKFFNTALAADNGEKPEDGEDSKAASTFRGLVNSMSMTAVTAESGAIFFKVTFSLLGGWI